ncbi:DUF4115 domain-containing protein [Salinimonas sp. HHU 13199]|uniref:DUF4115 domain-containing protein n=1 Tax=Salinimonas profundi TaxID=2729140 RepID=A0ABR8LKH9_9ALTE|nr:RodZ domain-containing protein [Salinimonas profundi]MBD3586694.1 DUF4115 domain-containing protein [Salinimonas profundi]
MNSEDVHHDTTANDDRSQSVSSPGAMLRQAREQQGLSQQDIADKIFVKVNTVDDIENDKIDQTMSVTFTKGYVRNYAKHLGLDANSVISAFERTHNNAESHARLQSFSQKVAKQAHDDRWMMVTYGILFLLVAGVVTWWYQQDDSVVDETSSAVSKTDEASGRASAVTASPRTESEPQAAGKQTQTQTDRQPNNEPAQNASLAQMTSQPVTAEETPSDALNQPTASQPEQAQQMEDENEAAPSQSDDTISAVAASNESEEDEAQSASSAEMAAMTFTFGEDCWVNIEDANGEIIATGIKREGRVMPISGQPPINVTLGAPDNVAVTFNGSSVDISDYQNGRTARFTLPLQE